MKLQTLTKTRDMNRKLNFFYQELADEDLSSHSEESKKAAA